MLTVSRSAGIGLPNIGSLFSVDGSVKVMFNTTRQDQTFTIPANFLPLLKPGDPTTINIFASAPGLDGQRDPNAPPGGEIYVQASIAATITIGGVITLDRLHRDRGGRQRHRRAPGGHGAVSTTIAYIGSLTGTLNLNVYAGATKTGVVGRIFLARSDAGSIPGISLTGQFLLEINTFASAQTIETFKIKKRTVDGVEFFDGFDLDAQGRLKIVTRHDLGHQRLLAQARRRPEVRPADDLRRVQAHGLRPRASR